MRPLVLAGKTALVTGASRGLGRAVGLRLALAGAQLVAVARTSGALEELDDEIREAGGFEPVLVPMDLVSPDGPERLASALYDRFGALDILVGAAAILGPLTPLGHLGQSDWERVLAVNLSVNWRLIRAFDPVLRRAPAGRAVFVTSGAARHPRAYWGAYCVAKAGLEALVRVYADECANTDLRVNLFDPGIMRTSMRAEAFPGEDPDRLRDPGLVADELVPLVLPGSRHHGETIRAGRQ